MRFEQIKQLNIDEMAAFLSWYFNCNSCPAHRDCCWNNDATCMDAIKDWLNGEGQL